MGRRLLSFVFGLAVLVWAGLAAAQGATNITYQPDAIPRIQYDKAYGDQQFVADQTKKRDYFLAIYSGSTMGTYFYVASGICRVIEAYFDKHNIHCVPLRSKGVTSNVDLIEPGAGAVHHRSVRHQPRCGGRDDRSSRRPVGDVACTTNWGC